MSDDRPPRRLPLKEMVFFLFVIGALVALIAPAILAAREAARRSECENNLKHLGLGLHNYADTYRTYLPTGTAGSRDLKPAERFSYLPRMVPFLQATCESFRFDYSLPWKAEGNYPPRVDRRINCKEPNERIVIADLEYYWPFSCPNMSRDFKIDGIQPTHYLGMAGLGADAPAQDEDSPHLGIWGYDRRTRLQEIADGHSRTILLLETNANLGPWLAGGRPTLRGVDTTQKPYLGTGRQFGGVHSICPALMADGSVKQLEYGIDSAVFESMVTMAAGD